MQTFKLSCRAWRSIWSISGYKSVFDKLDSFRNRANSSGCEEGNALFESTEAGCHIIIRPWVPLANFWSTARLASHIYVYMHAYAHAHMHANATPHRQQHEHASLPHKATVSIARIIWCSRMSATGLNSNAAWKSPESCNNQRLEVLQRLRRYATRRSPYQFDPHKMSKQYWTQLNKPYIYIYIYIYIYTQSQSTWSCHKTFNIQKLHMLTSN